MSRHLNVICGDCERHFVMTERAWFWHRYRHRAARQFRRDRAGLRRRVLRPIARRVRDAAAWSVVGLVLVVVEFVLALMAFALIYGFAMLAMG